MSLVSIMGDDDDMYMTGFMLGVRCDVFLTCVTCPMYDRDIIISRRKLAIHTNEFILRLDHHVYVKQSALSSS